MEPPIPDKAEIEPESLRSHEEPAILAGAESLAGYSNPEYDTTEEAARRDLARAARAERDSQRAEQQVAAMERARIQVVAEVNARIAAEDRAAAEAAAAAQAARTQELIDARHRSWPERNWGIFLVIAIFFAMLLLADANVPVLSDVASWVRTHFFGSSPPDCINPRSC